MRNARAVVAVAFAATAACIASPARADDTIKRPGDHPQYAVEIEPHGLWGWTHYDYEPVDGFGLGARFSIPIVDRGFVPSINDSVAIGFGVDWLHYSGEGCYTYYGPHGPNGCYGVGDSDFVVFPVVMQWNFFVARRWSVFGEPGLVIYHGFFDYCRNAPAGFPCAEPTQTGVDFAFYAGGRFHVNDHVALVLRIGYPTFSFGVSFM
ncbi:MAG TPA: hypothetical protein VGG39_35310 [Polyangiaceae bacterium]|jgi:hypothetical protein